MRTVRDIMQKDVVSVRDDMLVSDLVDLLDQKMITGAPVIDEQGALIGVVSRSDVATFWGRAQRKSAASPQELLASLEDAQDEATTELVDKTRVRDIMTPFVFQVSEDTPLLDLATTMVQNRLHRVIVTHGDKDVVGVVSTLDVVGEYRDLLLQTEPKD